MLLIACSVALSLSSGAVAEVHHLLASAFKSKLLFALEYDTVTSTLKETTRITANAAHSRLALSHDRTTLYGTERAGWSSYRVFNPQDLAFQKNLELAGKCGGSEYGNGFTNLVVGGQPPFHVFGAGRAPCANVLGVGSDGHLQSIVQNVSLSPTSRIQGMALDPVNEYLYSADGKANRVWTHKIDHQSGALSQARYTEFSEVNSRPSRLVIHPNSNVLYVMQTRANRLVVYNILRDPEGQPSLSFTGLSYSLVPPGVNGSNYRGQDIQVSTDQTVLYATTRFRVRRRQNEDENEDEEGDDIADAEDRGLHRDDDDDDQQKRPLTPRSPREHLISLFRAFKRQWPPLLRKPSKPAALAPGYLTAIRLAMQDGNDGHQAGHPLSVLAQIATSTSGGRSNAMSLASWDPELVALADSEKGLVQVWRFEGVKQLPKAKDIVVSPSHEQKPDQNPVQSADPKPLKAGPTKPPRPPPWQPSSVPGLFSPSKSPEAKPPAPPIAIPPPYSWSSSGVPLTSEVSVWIPPPLKPTASSTLISVASPIITNSKGPTKPGQGQWESSNDGDSSDVNAPPPFKGSPSKPSLQPHIPADQQASLPSPRQEPKPAPSSAPAASPKDGDIWINPWSSSKRPSPPAQATSTSGAASSDKDSDLIPEFVLGPTRSGNLRLAASAVTELGKTNKEFLSSDEELRLDILRRPGLDSEVTVRAAIVAEWKAPLELVGVGDPAASKDEESDRPRGPDGKKMPRWGRGCCAFALWLD